MLAVLKRQSDVIVILKTGGGKSMLAIVPSLLEKTATVMVLPLNSLIMDLQRRLTAMSIPFQIYSRDANGKGHLNPRDNLILVSADKAQLPGWREALANLNETKPIGRMIFDEAHLPLISKEYRNSALGNVDNLRHVPMQMVLLSATLPPSTIAELKTSFSLVDEPEIIRESTNRKELAYNLEKMQPENLMDRAIDIIEEETQTWGLQDRGLVFVCSIAAGQRLADKKGWPFYNGDREKTTDEQRRAAYGSWIQGASNMMVATSAFSTGNDYPHVRLVIHLDKPYEMMEYIQAQGRAGRDGLPARCYTLVPTTASLPSAKSKGAHHDDRAAMYEHLYVYGLKRCLRYGITLYNDGKGICCRPQILNQQLCSVCKANPYHDPTGIRIAAIPKSRSFLAPALPLPATSSTSSDSAPGPLSNNLFVKAAARVRSFSTAKGQQVADEAHQMRQALQTLSGNCSLCDVMQTGSREDPSHTLYECPCLGHIGVSSWEDYKRWRKQLKYTRNHKKICYTCHVPQINDALHPQFIKASERTNDCEFGDMIAPAAFGIYHNKNWLERAQSSFKQTWPNLERFTAWLMAPPAPGHYSNLIDLVLWYISSRSS